MNLQDLPLLIVALIVFAGVFIFLWTLDARARRLERELRDEIIEARDETQVRR